MRVVKLICGVLCIVFSILAIVDFSLGYYFCGITSILAVLGCSLGFTELEPYE